MAKQQRVPLLSARSDWIVLEILLLFLVTLIYTSIIWADEISKPSQTNLEIFKAITREVPPFSYLAGLYIVSIFEIGGLIMILYTHKIQQALAKGRAEGEAKGKAEGKAEGIAEGEAKGKAEGIAEGIAEGEAKGKAEGIAEGKAEGIAEGEAKGKAEERQLWLEWNNRRLEAEAKGEKFTESPPTHSQQTD